MAVDDGGPDKGSALPRVAAEKGSSDALPVSDGESGSPKKKMGEVVDGEVSAEATPAEAEEEIPLVGYFTLFRYANRKDALFIGLAAAGSILNGACLPIFTLVFGKMIDGFGFNILYPTNLQSTIHEYVLYYLYIGLAGFAGACMQELFWTVSSVRQVNAVRARYFHSSLRQDISYHEAKTTGGRLLQGLNEDCVTLQSAIGDRVGRTLFNLSQAFIGIIVAFIRGWDMTLVMLAVMPVLIVMGFLMSTLIARLTSKMNAAYADANALAQATLGNMRTVYAFSGEVRSLETYTRTLEEPVRVGIRQGVYSGGIVGLTNMVAFSCYALALWYGSTRVIAGSMTGGEVLNVLFAALIGGFALGQAAPNLQYFQQGRAAGARVFAMMDAKPGIDAQAPGLEPATVEGAILASGVHFSYPSRPDVPVLRGFDLEVKPGQTVALVGESGSGKSTVVGLLQRFYDPDAGSLELDGVDVRVLGLRWLRSQMGLVSQEPTLFATTIRENIRYGRPDASDADIEAASRAANAHRFVCALPMAYDTHVGEKGVQMSGGQKQRIAIARAILRDPRILLLDEATSALDAKSERVVQDALDRLMKGRTTIVIAHRLSTIREADQIAVVKQGRVVERGTHDELLQIANGAYSVLVAMQSGRRGPARPALSPDAPAAAAAVEPAASLEQELEAEAEEAAGEVSKLRVASALSVSPRGASLARAGSEPTPADGPGAADKEPEPQSLRQRWAARLARWKGADLQAQAERAAAEAEEDRASGVSWKRLAQLNRPELWALVSGVIGSAAMGAMMPAFSIAFSSLINVFFLPTEQAIEDETRKWCLVFVGIGVAGFLFSMLQSYSFNLMGHRLAKRVRVLMMTALLRQEIGWFDKEANASGVLTSKLSTDALAVKGQFGDSMGLITQNLVTFVGGYILAFIYGWKMTLVITSMVPAIIISAWFSTSYMVKASLVENSSFAQTNQTASEAFSSIRTVAAFGMEERIGELYARRLDQPTRQARYRGIAGGLGLGMSTFTIFAAYSLAFYYAGVLVSAGESTFQDCLRVFFTIVMAAFGVAQAQMYFPDVAKGKAATQRVFGIIDRQPLIDAAAQGGERLAVVQGHIRLDAVTFAYPQRREAPVFDAFTLDVPAGTTAALVGESGSGKSTVVGLVERFYDPDDGAVRLDGVDLRQLNLRWLRSQLSLVGQEPVLFSMTILENIRYGRPDASMEEVVAAADAANARVFVDKLPEGFHTKIGDGGILLSGGQKQRIAIARAVLRDPKVLLLDEATSALDAESERIVQDALDRIMRGRTTLVIAHRLSTIRDADQISVVHQGRIVEQGTHDGLMQLAGAYARLVAHQVGHDGGHR